MTTHNASQPHNFPWILSFFTAIAFLILIALGVWQLQRLEWKTNLQAQIDAAYDAPARSFSTHSIDRSRSSDLHYVKYNIEGRYLSKEQAFIQPRTRNGEIGKHVLALFRTKDGRILLINRGWAPTDWQESTPKDNTIQTLTGVFRAAERPNMFTPNNNAEQNIWYWPDIHAIAPEAVPALFWLIESGNDETYPIPQGDKPSLRNDHLQYAFFWFVMATVLILIYTIKIARDFQAIEDENNTENI